MTDLISETGEQRLVGERQTVILRRDVGENTQNLPGVYLDPAFSAPFRWPAAVDTTGEIPRLIEAPLGLTTESLRPAAPGPIPGPLPPVPAPQPGNPRPPVPPSDMAAAQPLVWPIERERVAAPDETAVQGILTALGADQPRQRKSVPYVIPQTAQAWAGARHAKPAPSWTKYLIGVGAAFVVWSALTLWVLL